MNLAIWAPILTQWLIFLSYPYNGRPLQKKCFYFIPQILQHHVIYFFSFNWVGFRTLYLHWHNLFVATPLTEYASILVVLMKTDHGESTWIYICWMETLSALPTLSERNLLVYSSCPSKRLVIRNFDVFFNVIMTKLLNIPSNCRLLRRYDVHVTPP